MFSKFLFGRPATDVDNVELLTEEKQVEVLEIETGCITTNPFQPRKIFSDEGLAELSSSIREFGVIQPLIVRQCETGYELIAGERRLRASILAGRTHVPCIVRVSPDKEMAEIAMIENLQREDLHYFEEAAGYEKLLSQFSLTQDDLAERVGKSQSTIANKLRLLKLSPAVRDVILGADLTERHARALLKIEQESEQIHVARTVIENKLTVKEAEDLIQGLGQAATPVDTPVKRPPMLRIVKDVRIFINTVHELVTQMKKTGLAVRVTQEQDEDTVTITMVVPKRR
jgi:ParB family chromosome partitioning protein